jgi:hypothetical protein
MKKNLPLVLFVLTFAFNAMAQQQQTPTPPPAPLPSPVAAPEANPADVSSMDAIIKAVYDVISGDAGVKRNWDRFRTLFHPAARMIPTGKNPNTGRAGARVLTPEDYIKTSGPFLEERGFHEREVARRVEQFGNIAHVFSTYEAKNKLSDAKPFMRGINSIQLLNDGKRWWVLTIAWSQETADAPIPEKYLKSRN